ncbi:tRNA-binding protein [Chryseobacterium sp. T1]
MKTEEEQISWADFSKIEMRVGTILEAEVFKEARKPAYKLLIDFGEFGIRKSSAQITKLYQPENLIGKQIVAVINFPEKQIATTKSQCLVMGAVEGDVVTLMGFDHPVKNGTRIG